MNNNETHFEANIEAEDTVVSKTITIQKQIDYKPCDKYKINYTALQFECAACDEIS